MSHAPVTRRVGGLAAAAAIAMAVATGQGVAHADPASDADTPSADATTSSSDADTAGRTDAGAIAETSATASTSGSTEPRSDDGTSNSPTEVPRGVASGSGGALTSSEYETDTDAESDDTATGTAETTTAPTPKPETPVETPEMVETPETNNDPPVVQRISIPSSRNASAPQSVNAPDTSPAEALRVDTVAVSTEASTDEAAPTTSSTSRSVDSSVAAATTLVAPTVSAPNPGPLEALIALPGRIITAATDFATNVLKALLAPLMTPAPEPPPDSPLLWTVLAWVRRQIQTTFFNQAPVATLGTAQLNTTLGNVIGRVVGLDPDGDELTFDVVEGPERGTVALLADGTYVYTPSDEFAAAGGADTFTVRVGDAGLHLHLFNDDHADIPVTVSLDPGQVPPPGAGAAYTFGLVNLTSSPLRLYYWEYQTATFVDVPEYGATLMPGETAHYRFKSASSPQQDAWMSVNVYTQAGAQAGMAYFSIPLVFANSAGCGLQGSVTCGPHKEDGPDYPSGNMVFFFNPAGTEIAIGPDNPFGQANMMNVGCQGDWGNCSFSAKSETKVLGEAVPIGTAIPNTTGSALPISMPYTSQGYGASTSPAVRGGPAVVLAPGSRLSEAVHRELLSNTAFKHGLTTVPYNFSGTYSDTIPANMKATFTFQPSLYLTRGDMTMTWQNTKYTFTDVYFYSPDPSGSGKVTMHLTPIV